MTDIVTVMAAAAVRRRPQSIDIRYPCYTDRKKFSRNSYPASYISHLWFVWSGVEKGGRSGVLLLSLFPDGFFGFWIRLWHIFMHTKSNRIESQPKYRSCIHSISCPSVQPFVISPSVCLIAWMLLLKFLHSVSMFVCDRPHLSTGARTPAIAIEIDYFALDITLP